MSSSREPAIRLESQGAIATLIIDQEAKRNAINQAMWQALIDILDRVEEDATIRVLLIRGAGDKAFSAGADIHEFSQLSRDPEKLKRNNVLVQRAQICLEALSRPTIAMIRGSCYGGGCGLALACDFRFCDDSAAFAITPAKLGLLYSVRDTRRLLNLVGASMARELLYTGRSLGAEEAEKIGLVNRRMRAADLEEAGRAFAEELAAASQYSLRGMKKTIAHLQQGETSSLAELERLFDQAFTAEDGIEGAQAFLQKRQPKFTFK